MCDKTTFDNQNGSEKSNAELILFPDYEKLKDEVAALRVEISMALLERDELIYTICKNIEMDYYLVLGSLEYKAYKAQCKALRLKRKIELIQARINRQEKVSLDKIEKILDDEFEEYEKKLDEMLASVNNAIERNKSELLSEEKTKELKSLYRKIVKKLHPDMNPDITEKELELFQNAVQAYENGDLATIRVIASIVEDFEDYDISKDSLAKLNDEKLRLEKIIKDIQDDILKIKSEYPYTLKEILDDPKKVEERKSLIEDAIDEYNELISIYNERIKEMLR